MKTSLRTILSVVLILATLPCVSFAATIPDPYPLPSLSGSYREDFIAVAESQLGYKEASDGSNYFAWWYRASSATSAWCSEFAAWCANQAGIPTSIIPKTNWSGGFRNYYMSIGRFYLLDGGIQDGMPGLEGLSTISITEAQPGDILLKETNGDNTDGPDHTAIFLSYSNGRIKTISGNTNDSVAYRYDSVSSFHGLCKPPFDGEETSRTTYTCTLPDTITSIPKLAYYDLTTLTDFTMGSQVTSIGRSAFSGCSNMTMHCEKLTLSEIGEMAFFNASAPTIVELRTGTLGDDTFYRARGLQKIIFTTEDVSIGNWAFLGASDLTEVVFEEGVTTVAADGYAFYGLYNDITVDIAGSVSSITSGVFPTSAKLIVEKGSYGEEYAIKEGLAYEYRVVPCEHVYGKWSIRVYPSKATHYYGNRARTCSKCGNIESESYQISVPTTNVVMIPDSVTVIEDEAFRGAGLVNVVIPRSVTSIGKYAFAENPNLKYVVVLSDTVEIPSTAFAECSRFTVVHADGTEVYYWGLGN